MIFFDLIPFSEAQPYYRVRVDDHGLMVLSECCGDGRDDCGATMTVDTARKVYAALGRWLKDQGECVHVGDKVELNDLSSDQVEVLCDECGMTVDTRPVSGDVTIKRGRRVDEGIDVENDVTMVGLRDERA